VTTNERFEQIMSAIAGTHAAVSSVLHTSAENTRAIADLNRSLMTIRDSIKSLETVAETLLESANKHEAVIVHLEKQLQAYLTRQPAQ
jgi:hypothetical protein